jgi:hypothetical protein
VQTQEGLPNTQNQHDINQILHKEVFFFLGGGGDDLDPMNSMSVASRSVFLN